MVSGWYQVILTIWDGNGGYKNASLLVGIQHEDTTVEGHSNRWYNIDPTRRRGVYNSVDVGPNIAHPTVSTEIELDRPLGSFTFIVTVIHNIDTDNETEIELHSEGAILADGTHLFNYLVNDDDFPDEIGTSLAQVRAYVFIEEGRCRGATIRLNAIFPMIDYSVVS